MLKSALLKNQTSELLESYSLRAGEKVMFKFAGNGLGKTVML